MKKGILLFLPVLLLGGPLMSVFANEQSQVHRRESSQSVEKPNNSRPSQIQSQDRRRESSQSVEKPKNPQPSQIQDQDHSLLENEKFSKENNEESKEDILPSENFSEFGKKNSEKLAIDDNDILEITQTKKKSSFFGRMKQKIFSFFGQTKQSYKTPHKISYPLGNKKQNKVVLPSDIPRFMKVKFGVKKYLERNPVVFNYSEENDTSWATDTAEELFTQNLSERIALATYKEIKLNNKNVYEVGQEAFSKVKSKFTKEKFDDMISSVESFNEEADDRETSQNILERVFFGQQDREYSLTKSIAKAKQREYKGISGFLKKSIQNISIGATSVIDAVKKTFLGTKEYKSYTKKTYQKIASGKYTTLDAIKNIVFAAAMAAGAALIGKSGILATVLKAGKNIVENKQKIGSFVSLLMQMWAGFNGYNFFKKNWNNIENGMFNILLILGIIIALYIINKVIGRFFPEYEHHAKIVARNAISILRVLFVFSAPLIAYWGSEKFLKWTSLPAHYANVITGCTIGLTALVAYSNLDKFKASLIFEDIRMYGMAQAVKNRIDEAKIQKTIGTRVFLFSAATPVVLFVLNILFHLIGEGKKKVLGE